MAEIVRVTANQKPCVACKKVLLKTELRMGVDSKYYCETCFDENFVVCHNCDNIENREDSYTVNDNYICRACYEEHYFCCEECGENYHNDRYGRDGRCRECSNNQEYVPYVQSTTCSATPNSLPLPWTYGFEIEVDGWKTKIPIRQIQKITSLFRFQIHSDSTLKNGIEFLSPPLRSDAGLKILRKFCHNIRMMPVEQTCGLHLHLGTKECSWEDLKKIWYAYFVLEPGLLSLLPMHRRINLFCLPLQKQLFEKERQYAERPIEWVETMRQSIRNLGSAQELLQLYYEETAPEKKDYWNTIVRNNHDPKGKRYLGFNLHSHFYRRTLEIRYHHGTVAYKDMYHWLVINMLICRMALTQKNLFDLPLLSVIEAQEQLLAMTFDEYPMTRTVIKKNSKKFNSIILPKGNQQVRIESNLPYYECLMVPNSSIEQ